jgi:DNA-directed RNA polymerase specialized sigma subunit
MIVECHFFIGLTIAEVAELLGLSKTKVERDWNFTRSWLKREMTGDR